MDAPGRALQEGEEGCGVRGVLPTPDPVRPLCGLQPHGRAPEEPRGAPAGPGVFAHGGQRADARGEVPTGRLWRLSRQDRDGRVKLHTVYSGISEQEKP